MRNESPVGLATILGVAPALIAGAVFIVLLFKTGGDVERSTALTIAIIGGLSLVGTAALRQWRSVAGAQAAAPTQPNVEVDGLAVNAHEGAEA